MNNYTTLNGGSQFQDLLEEIRKVDAIIAQGVNQRNQKLQSNESVQMIDRQITQQIDNLNETIKQARIQLNKSQFSQNESQRQKNILDQFQNRSEQFRKALQNKQVFKIDIQNQNIDYGQATNVELIQMQKQLVAQQDKTLDNMIDTTGRIQNNVKTMNLALSEDKVILRRLNENVEQATTEIKVTDSNLKTLLSYTSDCCLWTTIIVEFMIFVFLVIY